MERTSRISRPGAGRLDPREHITLDEWMNKPLGPVGQFVWAFVFSAVLFFLFVLAASLAP